MILQQVLSSRDRSTTNVPRLGPLCLHDGLDHHDRRRRLQPPLGAL